MEFLSRIDWHNHDGVNFGMINDFMRNQFYDRVLSRYVQDQHCTDIGFGTGLLTMLALKHGAAHVRAFESDPDRYQLGLEIVQRLELGHMIELINQRYDHAYQPTPVTFSETVNGNLWWEGLWNSLPRRDETVFLPGTYFLEIWAVTVPRTFAQGLCRPGESQRQFNPGVDIDPRFVQTVNDLAGSLVVCEQDLPQGLVKFERQQDTDWGWIPYLRAVQAGSVVARYQIQNYQDATEHLVLNIDTSAWRDSVTLLVPRMGMQQDSDQLYLDTGHWGPGENPVLLVRPTSHLQVQHNVRNGLITYSME